ncbi:hypothetical protein DL769_002889 [Monosporascus sp. CRB-8-3]|nr:hypothetical protein DL769_002889 [Monosporascus sp. CRB-8-3]
MAFGDNPPGFIGYTLSSSTAIQRSGVIYAGGNCDGFAIYMAADQNPPYKVYGSFFWRRAGYGVVMSVDRDWVLDGVVQIYTYVPNHSAVHRAAFSPESRFLCSADTPGNALWTHGIGPDPGAVEFVVRLRASLDDAHPHHVVVHPGGRYLYAVYEGSSGVAQYSIQKGLGFPYFAGMFYPLLRPHRGPEDCWADEVALSASGSYLWTTNLAYDIDGKLLFETSPRSTRSGAEAGNRRMSSPSS